MRLALLVSATLAACTFTPGGGSIDGGDTIDPIDTGDPIDTPPGCTASCGENTVTVCDGQTPVTQACALGCVATPTPHCRAFSPSNGVTSADAAAAAASLVVEANRVVLFHTDSGLIERLDVGNPGAPPVIVRNAGDGTVDGISFRRAAQAGTGVGLAVWGVVGFDVMPASGALAAGVARFVGPRAAVVLAREAITISGAIDSGAGRSATNTGCRQCGGAGGGNGGTDLAAATGCAPGGPGSYDDFLLETGGAGGGMSTQGSDGGDASAAGGASAPITACPDATLVPLVGGSGGGRGGFDDEIDAGGAIGGGGGGAVQLTSLVSLTVNGGADVYAGGQGGAGSVDNYGGGGGGAGGALLLEAPTVTVVAGARITANGGGGGSGRTANVGEAGNRSTSRASGGAGDGPGMDSGRGGRGGVSTDPTNANGLSEPGNGIVDGTGGGGASAGRIRINTAAATPPTISSTIVSPAASVGTRPTE